MSDTDTIREALSKPLVHPQGTTRFEPYLHLGQREVEAILAALDRLEAALTTAQRALTEIASFPMTGMSHTDIAQRIAQATLKALGDGATTNQKEENGKQTT